MLLWITVCKRLGKVSMFSSQICSCPIAAIYIFNIILAAKDKADKDWRYWDNHGGSSAYLQALRKRGCKTSWVFTQMVNIWTPARKKNLWTKSELLCVCFSLVCEVTAAFAYLCVVYKALLEVIEIVDTQRGSEPFHYHHYCSFPPRAAWKSYRLTSAEKPSVLVQYKGKQIFFPLGRADQEESSGLRWLRWSLRCSLVLTACGTVCACKMHYDWQEGPQTCKDFALFMYLFCNLK